MEQFHPLMCYWRPGLVNCMRIRTRRSSWGHSISGFGASSLFSKQAVRINACHTPPLVFLSHTPHHLSSCALFLWNIPHTLLYIRGMISEWIHLGTLENSPHLKNGHLNFITISLSGNNLTHPQAPQINWWIIFGYQNYGCHSNDNRKH